MNSPMPMQKVGSAIFALALTATLSCSDAASNDPDMEADPCANVGTGSVADSLEGAELRRAALTSIADNAIVASYREFSERSQALVDATDPLRGNPTEPAAAQEAWHSAMQSWQRAELMQFGPAGSKEDDIAGAQDLRFEIYSWPLVNRCRIDQEIVEEAYTDPEAFTSEAGNVRGLDAVEYLLFHRETTNDCAPNSGINRDGEWAALGDDEIVARRAAYAHTLAVLIHAAADRLLSTWESEFRCLLGSAGNGSSTYPSTQAALNEVSNALFYLDKETKDMKLAAPLALSDCDGDACPEKLESPWSRTSSANIVYNIEGFQLVFTGGDGLGFDDLLTDAGMTQVGADMIAALESAHEVCSQTGSLETDLAADPPNRDPGLACHIAIKAITDLLKTQFLGVLDLEPPDRAEGDND